MTISNRTLVQIAAWGGIIVSTTGFYLQHRLIDKVRENDYYKNALKRLRTHPGAVYYLGEPIKDKRFKITDPENNFADDKIARFRVPVSGPKDRGTYSFFAEKVDEEWKLMKAELELKLLLAIELLPTRTLGLIAVYYTQEEIILKLGTAETIPPVEAMRNELNQNNLRHTNKKPVPKSRKAKKALQRHMETVASLQDKETAGTSFI
ncbi:hypothetical protein MSG28_000369 [Choristoneura fumiferana]|uniref:Uncharacterized protein n=1 Tax=Choristoneura fumiferana TaxID=7141 RepID=A0ACC0K0R9_CHOFU|nr:hypothetical protein MSG28_000369 [Choristoneura fumiferana]